MRSVKLFLSTTLRAGLMVVGSAILVSALAGQAMAAPPAIPEAPEIDPGSISSAIALLVSGVAVITARRRK